MAELWQTAHEALTAKGTALAATGAYIEPDLGHSWYYDNPATCKGLGAASGDTCGFNDQNGGGAPGPVRQRRQNL